MAPLSPAQSEGPRTFRNADGSSTIQASVLSVKGDNVELKRSDGKSFVLPINRLSVDDALYLKEWRQQHPDNLDATPAPQGTPRVTLAVYTGKTSKKDDQISGFLDEKKQKLSFGVELENEDRSLSKVTVGGVLLVFGESMDTGRGTVVYKEVLPMTELALYKPVRLEAKPFELWYDDEGAVYGFKYTGYVVVIKDAKGTMVAEKTIPGSANRYLKNVLKLEAGDEFNKDYEKVDQVSQGTLQQAVKMR
jgi:hypothetical protein